MGVEQRPEHQPSHPEGEEEYLPLEEISKRLGMTTGWLRFLLREGRISGEKRLEEIEIEIKMIRHKWYTTEKAVADYEAKGKKKPGPKK